MYGGLLEGVLKLSVGCLEGVWKVTSLRPTSPSQLGTNFYFELEFDSGVDPTCLLSTCPKMVVFGHNL